MFQLDALVILRTKVKLGVKTCIIYSRTLKDTCDWSLGHGSCQPFPQVACDPAARRFVAFILVESVTFRIHLDAWRLLRSAGPGGKSY